MQGFNKYYPPDYDGEKHGSLNSYRGQCLPVGKHALGDRARKIGEGILITRFELPFNIWCGTCNNHIGMGVRYNAEKKKIGNYFSTPIYSFRCKCHLCSGWFEIQTDPKNTRYVVTSGARQKDEDWDPEENGGYAIHDTEGKDKPADPLAALEKSTDAQTHVMKVQVPRLEAIQDLSDRYNEDPYFASVRVRKRFRLEKKVDMAKKEVDDAIKGRYGISEDLKLLEDGDDEKAVAKKEWIKGRMELHSKRDAKKRKLEVDRIGLVKTPIGSGSGSSSSNALSSLRARILENTARRSMPSGGSGRSKPPDARLIIRK